MIFQEIILPIFSLTNFHLINSINNEHGYISVKNEDKDSFEKCISVINDFGEKINNPNEQKKNKIKAKK